MNKRWEKNSNWIKIKENKILKWRKNNKVEERLKKLLEMKRKNKKKTKN